MKKNTIVNNLAIIPQEDMDKVNVDLIAAGVAFKERYNIPVTPKVVELEQPVNLRYWFRKRLIAHRLKSIKLSRVLYESKSNNFNER